MKGGNWRVTSDRTAANPQSLIVDTPSKKRILIENTTGGIVAKPASTMIGPDDMKGLASTALKIAQITQGVCNSFCVNG